MHPNPILTAASALLLLGTPAQASDPLSSGDSPTQQFRRSFLNAPGEVRGLQVSGNDWQELNLTFRFTLSAPLKLPKPGPGLKSATAKAARAYAASSKCAATLKASSRVRLETTWNKLAGRLIVENGQSYCASIWNVS